MRGGRGHVFGRKEESGREDRLLQTGDQPCTTRGSCFHSKDGDNVPAGTEGLGTSHAACVPQGEGGPELRTTQRDEENSANEQGEVERGPAQG